MSYTEFTCDPVHGSNLSAGSTNTAPVYTSTGGNWNGTTIFTPTDGSTPANTVSVGMFASVYVTSGATVATYIARITAVGAGVNGTITLSASAKSGAAPGSGSGTLTIVVGGYWQGPNGATAFPFGFITSALTDSGGDFPRVNFLNTATYSITAAITHANGGPCVFQGCASSPGDGGRAVIDGGTSGASYVLLTVSAAENIVRDLICQNNGATSNANGTLFSNNRIIVERVTVQSVRGHGIQLSASATAIGCEAYNCNQNNSGGVAGFILSGAGALAVRCVSHHNPGNSVGFSLLAATALEDCVADTNGTTGFFVDAGQCMNIKNCTAYNNGGDGIKVQTANTYLYAENNILSNNGGYGINNASTPNYVRSINNAYYSNTSGQTNAVNDETGAITCASSPLNAPSQGDYTSTAAGGVRNTGYGFFEQNSGSWTSFTGTTGYPDAGAVQHLDSGGGGGMLYIGGMSGGCDG